MSYFILITVDPEDLRKISGILSHMGQEKQRALKVITEISLYRCMELSWFSIIMVIPHLLFLLLGNQRKEKRKGNAGISW